MRIIAGRWRGRRLAAPPGGATRPTADRVRQALFDSLMHAPWGGREMIEGARVLDAFAGTGALGLEALSRGAAHATFFEPDRAALAALRDNIAGCGAEACCTALAADAAAPPQAAGACGLVFLDPPYRQGLVTRTLAALRAQGWIAPGALLVIETARGEPPPAGQALLERLHGAARISVMRAGHALSIEGELHMQHRPLGRSGLSVPPLTIGGNVFGWTADAATSHRLLDMMTDAGLTAIDTADIYSTWGPGHSGGESETVIGDWLARTGKRDQVTIATKLGMKMPGGEGLSRAWIMRAAEDSLRRLRTDRIDLYQAHRDDADTPLQETLGAFAELIRQGKVRAIGASNYTAGRLREALDVSRREGLPRYESLQPHYNLLERPAFEGPLAELCRTEELGVIPYFSLAAGFLTGKYRSEADLGQSPRGGGMEKYLNGKGQRVLAALDTVAQRRGATPAQVALAWLIARPGITAPIASASRPEQVEDLVRATTLSLHAGDVQELDAASAEP